jgi:hypothetical protein
MNFSAVVFRDMLYFHILGGADGEEVTLDDLIRGTAGSKAGYQKVLFCGKQATTNDLHYFWVDTCCTIQTHPRRQCPTKRVAYAAENDGSRHLALKYQT